MLRAILGPSNRNIRLLWQQNFFKYRQMRVQNQNFSSLLSKAWVTWWKMDSRGVMILEMPVQKRIPERNLSQAEEQPSSPKWRRPYLGWKKGFCFHLLASLRSCPSWYQLNLRERQRQQMMDWVQVRSSQMQELIRQYLLNRATAQNTIFSFLKGNSFCLFRLRMNSMNFYRYPCVNISSLPV